MRKVDNYSAKVVAVVAMVLVASAVQAVTTNTWKTTCMAPNTPATAYLWNEPSNWDKGQVPAAHDVVEFPIPSNVYYVRVPDEGVMVTPDTIPFRTLSTRVGAMPESCSPFTLEMAAVTTLFFWTP